MQGLKVPHDIYCHIAGIDLVRVDEDTFYVLEDNARTPSGASYSAGEPRSDHGGSSPNSIARHRIAPVENYPDALLACLQSVAPRSGRRDPNVAGLYAGAVQFRLLRALLPGRQARGRAGRGERFSSSRDEVVYMRTTEGPQRLDVLYRSASTMIFLRPARVQAGFGARRSGYLFGGPIRAGNITLANASARASPTTRRSIPTCPRS